METIRQIKKITRGSKAVDGAGVKLVRVVGRSDTSDYDPFLLLDAFDSDNPEDYIKGFPWHPHRGIETITYLIEGRIEHGDSLGNKGVINSGDCQWMTAGSGIIHQEMPQPSKRLLGAQLWLNLPSNKKMTDPKYGDILKKDVPVVTEGGSRVHVISGTYRDTPGAFEGEYIKATYLDVELEKHKEWIFKTDKDDTLFIYIVYGEGEFPGKTKVDLKNAVLFKTGDTFKVKAGSQGMRFLLFSAPPLNEPIAWGGPIVMNTREELRQAFQDLDNGTFTNH